MIEERAIAKKRELHWDERFDLLDDFSMGYETAVVPMFSDDYLQEFYDFYRIRNRQPKLIPSEGSFHETLKEVSGDNCWRPIAEKTELLLGLPDRVTVFEDDEDLREEMGAPPGIPPPGPPFPAGGSPGGVPIPSPGAPSGGSPGISPEGAPSAGACSVASAASVETDSVSATAATVFSVELLPHAQRPKTMIRDKRMQRIFFIRNPSLSLTVCRIYL